MKSENLTAPDPAITFLFPKDIMRVLPHITSYNGAWLHYKLIKDTLGKQKHQRITILEFATYEGFPVSAVVKALSD
jgi:hypothetical protein